MTINSTPLESPRAVARRAAQGQVRRTSAANWRMRAEPCAGRGAREVAICRSSIGYPKNELRVAKTHDGNGSIETISSR
jgi:hypothetical protein